MLLRIKYIAARLQIIFTRIRMPVFDIIKFYIKLLFNFGFGFFAFILNSKLKPN